MPLGSDPIMSGTSTWSFRHLEHQNLSSNRSDNLLVSFLATKEAVTLLANYPIMLDTLIQSFIYL